MVFRCVVSNCKNKYGDEAMHVFPRDLDLFKIWSEKVGRADIKLEERTKYRICDVHFSEDDKFVQHQRTNLKADAVPSLFLSGAIVATQGTPKEVTVNITEDTDQQISGGLKRTGSPVELLQKKSRTSKFQKRPSFHIDIRRRTNLLKMSNTTRESHLGRRARKYYYIAKNIINTARKLNRQNATNKEHIKRVIQFAESGDFLKGKVNNTTFKFINSQITLQKKKTKGRRYTIDDKIFALSLLKQSPKGYRLLEKIFALPSRKTLMTMLNKIPFTCGINTNIMMHLKRTVDKMNDMDKYCCLLFDDMSLEAALNLNQIADCMEGFENCGGTKEKIC